MSLVEGGLLVAAVVRGSRCVFSQGWRVEGGRPWGVKRIESVGVVVGDLSWSEDCDCACDCCCSSGKTVPGGR